MGKKLYYNNAIEGSYDLLFIGKSNEPETHEFFKDIVPNLDLVNFIDVGASIGEMVFGISTYKNVNRIFAFEPREECVKALNKSVQLNNESRIEIHDCIVSELEGYIDIFHNPGGTSSGIYGTNNAVSTKVRSAKLDSILPVYLKNTILLIDVEGAEPSVMKSGLNFIKNNNPLIIFEYNSTSKKHFCLDDVRNILGKDYDIYRLRGDGSLDIDFTNSWNCVAIPLNSQFSKFCKIIS